MISIQVADSVTESLSAYCFGRVLAERFGFYCAFPQLRNLVRDWQSRGTRHIGTEVIWSGQWPFEYLTGRKLHPEELCISPNARLRLFSGFHRWELFAEETDRIREQWLAPLQGVRRRPAQELAVALSLPAGKPGDDEKPAGNCLTEHEIRRLVRAVKPSQLVLIASRADHPLLAALADLSPSVAICAGWSQILLIRSFQKVALSQDATHWWGAFLGEAAEIYFPPLDRGPWSHPEPAHLSHEPSWHGIDLRVPANSRYSYDW